MAICARGSVLVFYAVFAVFFTSLWGFFGGGGGRSVSLSGYPLCRAGLFLDSTTMAHIYSL